MKEISPRDPFVRNIFLNQDGKDKLVGLGQLTLFRCLFFLINVSFIQHANNLNNSPPIIYLFIYL